MRAPRELTLFSGKGDARKLFYVFENVIMKGASDEDKAEKVVAYLQGEAFDFYFERFTNEDSLT